MDDNNLNSFVIAVLEFLESKDHKLARSLPSRNFYRGTTTADRLLGNKHIELKFNSNGPLAFIINTIHSGKAPHVMGHWLGLSLHFNQQKKLVVVRYFDSFGDRGETYKNIWQYITNIKRQCKKRDIRFRLDRLIRGIQYHDSKLCGPYAAFFIAKSYCERNRIKIAHIFKHFKKDRIKNDLMIQRFLVNNYPSHRCHDNPIYNKMKVSLDTLRTGPMPPFCPRTTLGLEECLPECGCVGDCNH